MPNCLTELSLFSGYGGFSLGLRLAGIPTRIVLYVEIEPYCQEIIRARIRDGFLGDAPIWPDVRTLDGRLFAGKVGIITAGVPCQPDSYSGKRKGANDPRNLWPETLRIVDEIRPPYLIFEAVPGILWRYFHTIRPELQGMGYELEEKLVTAVECGAYHKRERLWIFAYTSKGGRGEWGWPPQQESEYQAMARVQLAVQNGSARMVAGPGPLSAWPLEARICGNADGCPHRVDRLRALGNGIVPAVVRLFLNGGHPT